MAGGVVTAQQAAPAPTAKPKSQTVVKPGMAARSPEVQKTLGVTAENFNAEGLNRLTQAQLTALLISAKPDPREGLLMCPASGTEPAGRVKVLVTVAGDDSSGLIAGQIRQAVSSLSGVDLVDVAANADRALNVVIPAHINGAASAGSSESGMRAKASTGATMNS